MIGGYGFYASQENVELSVTSLDNVEALAGETGTSPCGGPKEDGECQSRNTIGCKDLSGCK